MTSCSGCGCVLGWKKYKFQRMWHIDGYYCKRCMMELGADFDKNARLTLPSRTCGLCGGRFFFLKPHKTQGRPRAYCVVCLEAVRGGAVPAHEQEGPRIRPQPKQLPLAMIIFAGLGGLMMIMGLIFTMMSTGEDANVLNILFGAATTAMGFVLVRRTLKSRSLLMGGGGGKPPPGR